MATWSINLITITLHKLGNARSLKSRRLCDQKILLIHLEVQTKHYLMTDFYGIDGNSLDISDYLGNIHVAILSVNLLYQGIGQSTPIGSGYTVYMTATPHAPALNTLSDGTSCLRIHLTEIIVKILTYAELFLRPWLLMIMKWFQMSLA